MPNPPEITDVLATEELHRRTNRAPNLTAQNEAMHTLARALSSPPAALEMLLAVALKHTEAGTVGISLLERTNGEQCFRWIAIAGEYAKYLGGSTPRQNSPCGYTLDAGTTQLFLWPHRFFKCIAAAEPQITEGLVLPFYHDTTPWGTIWITSHDTKNLARFDMEDVRLMESLAGFTSDILRMLGYTAPD